jgi:hypothetical protein
MEIKITLKRLKLLFAESASNEDLPEASRQLAARQTVAVAHIERLEAKINGVYVTLDKHIGELTGLVAELAKRLPQPENAPAPTPAAENANDAGGEEAVDDDAEAKAMAARILAETEAETKTALVPSPPPSAPPPPAPAPVTPIRKANAGKTPVAGDAS